MAGFYLNNEAMMRAPMSEQPRADDSQVERLVNCKKVAVEAMELLAEEFAKIGARHYTRMVLGQTDAIEGAVIVMSKVLRDSDSSKSG